MFVISGDFLASGLMVTCIMAAAILAIPLEMTCCQKRKILWFKHLKPGDSYK